ncbi:leucyl aminopeptidase family protein [Holospora curviuscula]|uniref:Cytosol aminopeptidase n=1 Tax=Holospora curviuscula TaxID=1082868 RepID=A0A2S5R7N6_9PROT|nr:hypothetical protein [Holospora curviuscula]PPE03303.1 Cytosol aminopeptidase [Holospora curviuscula]
MWLSFRTVPKYGISIVLVLEDFTPVLLHSHPLFSWLAKTTSNLFVHQGHSTFCTSPDGTIIFLLSVDKEDLVPERAAKVVGALFMHLNSYRHCAFFVSFLGEALHPDVLKAIGLAILLRDWNITTYRTSRCEPERFFCQNFLLIHPEAGTCGKSFQDHRRLARAINWSRDLMNAPSNLLSPKKFIQLLLGLKNIGIVVEVLDQRQLAQKGFRALLWEAQFTQTAPYVVILTWKGKKKGSPLDQRPLAFVGRGASLYSKKKMGEMKMDRAGASVICGILANLALRKSSAHVVGVVALVENIPSKSLKDLDNKVISLSGHTIEVLSTNTDGCLTLADALWYTQNRFNPTAMIDLATLTDTIGEVLGAEYAGLFSNCDGLADQLLSAGNKVDEKLWRLPIVKSFDPVWSDDHTATQTITYQNDGFEAYAAAQFLHRFVNKTPWAHIDISCVTFFNQDTPRASKGGRAFGLRALDLWIKNYEKNTSLFNSLFSEMKL